MRSLLIFVSFFITYTVSAQISINEYVFKNGWKLKVNDSVQIGRGSWRNERFNYIISVHDHKKSLSPSRVGAKMKIISARISPMNGKAILILLDSNGEKYTCHANDALKAKEIVPPADLVDRIKKGPVPLSYEDSEMINSRISSEEIYARLTNWYTHAFGNGKNSIVTNDSMHGSVIIKASFPYQSKIVLGNYGTAGKVLYLLKINYGNGYYSCLLSDFEHTAENDVQNTCSFGLLTIDDKCPQEKVCAAHNLKWSNKVWTELKAQSDSTAKKVIDGLKAAMQ